LKKPSSVTKENSRQGNETEAIKKKLLLGEKREAGTLVRENKKRGIQKTVDKKSERKNGRGNKRKSSRSARFKEKELSTTKKKREKERKGRNKKKNCGSTMGKTTCREREPRWWEKGKGGGN